MTKTIYQTNTKKNNSIFRTTNEARNTETKKIIEQESALNTKKTSLDFRLTSFGPHSAHMVDVSPWPFLVSMSLYATVIKFTAYLHGFEDYTFFNVLPNFTLVVIIAALWWRDIIRESTGQGYHTLLVQRGLKIGMVLFIISEVMFFFAIFWAFFNNQINPSIHIYGMWPPMGIKAIHWCQIPLLNTLCLVTSGISMTWTHHSLINQSLKELFDSYVLTLLLAVIFTALQFLEYQNAPFSISDSVFGSCFFLATGFHGFHVLIGTIFLLVCFLRILKSHLSTNHHIGFESASWYWHFVDVVWIFLFGAVYWLPSLKGV